MTNPKIKYLYILSPRYSGSTLLSFLLGTHQGITTVGERRKIYNKSLKSEDFQHHRAKLCSCGQSFDSCAYWLKVKKAVLEQTNPKDLKTNTTEFKISNNRYLNRVAYEIFQFFYANNLQLSSLPFSKKIKQLTQFNETMIREILRIDNNRIFLDSSKVINHALFLSLIESFEFYVIWLIRDPRAQINSARKYNDWTVAQAAEYLKKEMQHNEQIMNKVDIPFYQLKYEDLCKEPEKQLKTIAEFTGLDVNDFSLEFRNYEQHIIGNAGMRLGKDKKIVERQDWKNKLSKHEIQLIQKQLAPQIDQFQYIKL